VRAFQACTASEQTAQWPAELGGQTTISVEPQLRQASPKDSPKRMFPSFAEPWKSFDNQRLIRAIPGSVPRRSTIPPREVAFPPQRATRDRGARIEIRQGLLAKQ